MRTRSPAAELMRLIGGYQVSQAIHVAASLGIADVLRDGPRSNDEIALATGTHARSLYRLMRALAAVGVFEEQADRRFVLAPLGECLRSDAPQSRRTWAAYAGRPYVWQSWGALLHNVRTGETAFDSLHGAGIWEWRAGRPEESGLFDAAMTALSRIAADAIAEACDFSAFGCVVDVGGGQGALLAGILARHAGVRGILYDLPHVVSGAQPVLEAAGVSDRCQIRGGDFFSTVPEGGDAYVVKSVLMDEEDDEAIAILRACRLAMTPAARLLVIERMVGQPNQSPEGKFSDLNMMVMTGGRERTEEEFAALFSAAGFRLDQVIATSSPSTLIVGSPV